MASVRINYHHLHMLQQIYEQIYAAQDVKCEHV